MTRRDVAQALGTLAQGGWLPEILQAVEAVGQEIGTEGDRSYLGLEAALPGLPLPARQAGQRFLLDARRTSRRWEVLSMDQEGGGLHISRSLTALAQQLESPNVAVRLSVLEDLVRDEVFPAAPAIATRLQIEDTEVVQAALAHALGILGGQSSIPLLKRYSRSESWAVRMGALEGLGFQTCETSLRLTLDRLADEHRQVRALARELAGTHCPDRVVSMLARIPLGRGERITREILRVIHVWVGFPCVDAMLQRLSHSPSREVRSLAIRILGVQATRRVPHIDGMLHA